MDESADRDDHGDTAGIRFIADGHERAAKAIRKSCWPRIEAEVTAQYADVLTAAGQLGKLWIRMEIKSEIRRRISEEIVRQAPPDALY